MKKILFYSVVFLLSFFIATSAKAISGACSSHEGVNCGASAANGSVICNDGWGNSSVKYETVLECCIPPSSSGCKTEDDYSKLTIYWGERGGFMNSQISGPGGVWETCRNQINNYSSQLTTYNNCLSKSRDDTYSYNVPAFNEQEEGNKICREEFGNNIFYNIQTTKCTCETGYYFSKTQQKCSSQNSLCQQYGAKEYRSDIKNCICEEGYIFVNNKCMTHAEDCQRVYGINVKGEKDKEGNINASDCTCIDGYIWSSDKKYCTFEQKSIIYDSPVASTTENYIQNTIKVEENKSLEEEKKLSQNEDKKMSEKLSGRILLQVEKNGEGWYLNPNDKKKYYLGRPADAFNAMRNLGLGIKHDELEKYLKSKFPDRLSGKIMLDVEQNGEAYYINPTNLKGYFLNRPKDAFKVMRELGLGITNTDIRKISVGE